MISKEEFERILGIAVNIQEGIYLYRKQFQELVEWVKAHDPELKTYLEDNHLDQLWP